MAREPTEVSRIVAGSIGVTPPRPAQTTGGTDGGTGIAGDDAIASGTPARQRVLRDQGRKTQRRLLDAGLRVFADRGYHAARIDDVVRMARTSHGTFYLYFSNKEDLLRALAVDCAEALLALAKRVGPIAPDAGGSDELRRVLGEYLDIYARYGPVIQAWMDREIDDREIDRLGTRAYTSVAEAFAVRMRGPARAAGFDLASGTAALMAMLERFAHSAHSYRLALEPDHAIDTLTLLVHRGFFGAGRPVPTA